jgi:hypothetical protein
MIKFTEASRAIWFMTVLIGKQRGDVLAHAEETATGGTKLTYRHRWYAEGPDQDPFNGRDRKSWYEAITGDPPHVAITKFERAFDLMVYAGGTGESYSLIRGERSLEEFQELFLSQPFNHQRPATPEEIAEIMAQGPG